MIEKKHSPKNIKAELLRKGIHLLIALVPALAAFDLANTALLLMLGMLFYASAESLRFLGFPLPLISSITATVSRRREQDCFVLGPVTLALGALLSILLFPAPVAALAIYILAFSDSASALIGKSLGRFRPAFLAGKSVEGSVACFAATFLICFFVLSDLKTALAVAFASTLADALPLGDFDNLVIPLVAGVTALAFA